MSFGFFAGMVAGMMSSKIQHDILAWIVMLILFVMGANANRKWLAACVPLPFMIFEYVEVAKQNAMAGVGHRPLYELIAHYGIVWPVIAFAAYTAGRALHGAVVNIRKA